MTQNTKSIRNVVLISCGGTGGHLEPGIALGEALSSREGVRVEYAVNRKKIGRLFLARMSREPWMLPEIRYRSLLRGRLISLVRDIRHTIEILRRIRFSRGIGLVVSAGGGAGVLPVLYFRRNGVPAVLLEQNVLMGKANRFLLKRAERVYANFPCTNAADESRIRVAGNPIRSELLEGVPARDEAVRRLGLEPGTFTLLFMGGSQGARAVNEIALELVPALKTGEPIPFQVIHLAGEVMCGRLREFYRELGIRAFCEAFTDRMKTVYAASDLAVTRAGGGSLSELLHFGVPPIMIPFPFAAENHQEANARYLEECGCGFAVPQCECDSKALAVRIREWIRDPGLLAPVKKKHETLRFQKSAEAIAGDCVSVMRRFAENSAGNNAGETA